MSADTARPQLDFDVDLARWTPRQQHAVDLMDSGLIKFLLYGGALGGGKSYFLRWFGVRFLMNLYSDKGLTGVPIMLACEDYTSLKDRQLSRISREFPPWMGEAKADHRDYGRCFILAPEYGSGIMCFRNLDDPSKYASSEFAAILVDELTKNRQEVFDHLRTRLRWPGLADIECPFIGGTNPGSVGHGWVKALWMDQSFPVEYTEPIDYRSMFAYVPSRADDNPHLDSAYWSMLSTLPLNLRKAFRDGNWDVFLGQAFPEFGEAHKIKPIPVPDHAPLYMTFDWGYGKPFSVGWWWVDGDSRVYRCAEWYGFNGTPDEGLRMADTDIAQGIREREKKLGIDRRPIIRLAGPDCWNKKPDYKGGGQGPSTAEVFAANGLYLAKGDPSRALKIRQFRERLRVPTDGTRPMLVVYDTCTQFLRTIPSLPLDSNNIEDVDTAAEDHIFDEACHVCMSRPLVPAASPRLKTEAEARIDYLEDPRDPLEKEMATLQRQLEDEGAGMWGGRLFGEYDDPDVRRQLYVSTVE